MEERNNRTNITVSYLNDIDHQDSLPDGLSLSDVEERNLLDSMALDEHEAPLTEELPEVQIEEDVPNIQILPSEDTVNRLFNVEIVEDITVEVEEDIKTIVELDTNFENTNIRAFTKLLVDKYTEDRVFIVAKDKAKGVYKVELLFPYTEITNTSSLSIEVENLVVRFYITIDPILDFKGYYLSNEHGDRLSSNTVTIKCLKPKAGYYRFGYIHPHVMSSNINSPSYFNYRSVCMGSSTVQQISNYHASRNFNNDSFELYLLALEEFLKWESIEGSPYYLTTDILNKISSYKLENKFSMERFLEDTYFKDVSNYILLNKCSINLSTKIVIIKDTDFTDIVNSFSESYISKYLYAKNANFGSKNLINNSVLENLTDCKKKDIDFSQYYFTPISGKQVKTSVTFYKEEVVELNKNLNFKINDFTARKISNYYSKNLKRTLKMEKINYARQFQVDSFRGGSTSNKIFM